MANQLFINDRTNPLLLPARPVSGGDINWDSQVGQPGLSPIFADFTSELQKLYIETDATIVGKGIKENNIANLAVLPQNQREIINTPYKNRLVNVQSGVNTPYPQVDGQPLIKKILLPPFQVISNFRNFQSGVDNVTTELNIKIKNFNIQGFNLATTANYATTLAALTDGTDAEIYKNIKIITEVDSTSAFLAPTIISKESFFSENFPGYANWLCYMPWDIEVIDKTAKSYQNPWYRTYLVLEKTFFQATGITLQLFLQMNIDCKYKCKNKHI
jgi:hypothetical protein